MNHKCKIIPHKNVETVISVLNKSGRNHRSDFLASLEMTNETGVISRESGKSYLICLVPLILGVIIIFWSFFAFARPVEQAFDNWQKGAQLYHQNDYKNALPFYKKAVDLMVDDVVYIAHYGRCLTQLEQYETAITHLEHALQIMKTENDYPTNPYYIASYWLGKANCCVEYYSDAAFVLESYLHQISFNEIESTKLADVYILLAEVYFKQDQYDRALEYATNTLHIQMPNEKAHHILTNIYLLQGKYNKALEQVELISTSTIRDSLKTRIRQTKSLYQTATKAVNANQWQEAQQMLNQVLERSPLFERVRIQLHYIDNQIKQAKLQRNTHISLGISIAVIILGIVLMTWLGRTLYDRQQLLNIERARNAFIQGNYERAELLFRAALKEQPNNIEALLGLAEVYATTREYNKEVITTLEKAILQTTDKRLITILTHAMEEAFKNEELIETTRHFFQELGFTVIRRSSRDLQININDNEEYRKYNHALIRCLSTDFLSLEAILNLWNNITHSQSTLENNIYNSKIAFLTTDGIIPQEIQNQIYTFISGVHPVAILPLRQFLMQRAIYESRAPERLNQIYTQIVGQIDLFEERSKEAKITNLYITGNPIKEKTMFFGREDIFHFIRTELETRRKDIALVLYGERRIGKTSTLYQISNGELGEQFIPVIMDMQEMADVDTHDFFKKMSTNISRQLENTELPLPQQHRNIFILSQDDPTIRLIGVTLKIESFIVQSADNLEKALNIVQEKRPILMIIDMEIGEQLINQFQDKLTQFPKIRQTPFLFIYPPDTASLERDDENQYIEKPLSHDRIIRKVEEIIKKQKLEDTSNPFIQHQLISFRKTTTQYYNFENIKQNPYSLFDSFLDDITEITGNKSLLFLFDEYELLSRKVNEGSLSSDIYAYFRHLMEQRSHLIFIFVGSQMLEELKEQYLPEMFNVARYRKIGLLKRQDAIQLMTRPVQGSVVYDDEAIDYILQLAAGHPYLIQCLCRNIITLLNDDQRTVVETEDVEESLKELIENPPPHLIYLWNEEFNSRDRLILSLVCELTEITPHADTRTKQFSVESIQHEITKFDMPQYQQRDIENTLDLLIKKDIIIKIDRKQTYQFQINLIHHWIREEHSIWKTIREETTQTSSIQ